LAKGVVAPRDATRNGRNNFSGECEFFKYVVFGWPGEAAGEASFILDARVGEG